MVSEERLAKAYELQKAFGFLYYDEVGFLAELADGLPENAHIVNIGAGVGTSALTFLEIRSDLRVTTIDIRKEAHGAGALENEMTALKKADLYDLSRYAQVHEDSKTVGVWWSELVEMVFIDGEHSYENCLGDIKAWLPHIKDNGIMAVHDYAPPWPQVRKAVDELLTDKYEHMKTVDSIIAFRIKHNDN
jgi:predicted O-methyltransferase YrrM